MLKLRLINAVEVLFILSSRLLMLLTNEPYCKESDYWIRIFIIILEIDSKQFINDLTAYITIESIMIWGGFWKKNV